MYRIENNIQLPCNVRRFKLGSDIPGQKWRSSDSASLSLPESYLNGIDVRMEKKGSISIYFEALYAHPLVICCLAWDIKEQ